MKKEYKFSGSFSGKSIVVLEDDKLKIKRKGFLSFLNYGLKGEKTIQISSITGTQYKKSGAMNGYLQFVMMGSQENKGGLSSAQKDENSVVWVYKKCNKYAEEIIQYIEQHNSTKKPETVKVAESDKYDQLAKVKKLLDEGILSKEEYEQEKKKILQ